MQKPGLDHVPHVPDPRCDFLDGQQGDAGHQRELKGGLGLPRVDVGAVLHSPKEARVYVAGEEVSDPAFAVPPCTDRVLKD